MKTQPIRFFLSAAVAAAASVAVAPGRSLADTWISANQGKVDLANVGVIYSYVHENVPAGTSVTIETVNLTNSPATVSYLDTVIHVFDRYTRQHIASNDDCPGAYSSCLTLPANSGIRSYVIYVHAYSSNTHGNAELRISHAGFPMVDSEPFSFGGVRAYVNVNMPLDTHAFTTGFSSPPLGTRLLALNYTTSVLAVDDNGGGMGFSDMHLPAALGAGGSFVIGAHGGLLYGGPPDTAGVSLHWNGSMNYMLPVQKKIEDTAYEILREAAQAPDGRWFTAFDRAFGGRIDWDEANDIKNLILQGQRYPVTLQFVDPSVLVSAQGQALGAYGSNKIFLSTVLMDPYTAGNIFIEEIAHHFDITIGGAGDAPGDEGHIFWSYIVGEGLTAAELADLKALNDAGTICVSGQCYAVEFLGWPTFIKKFAGSVWGGIKSGGGWIWTGATTVGGALQTAANATWNGSQVLGGWIQQGASVAADKVVEGLQRTGYAGYGQLMTAVDSIHDLGLGVYDGAKIMSEGMADIGRGNFKDGVAALFVGLAKLSVEAPLSTLVGEVVGTIGAVQVLLFLEPIGRPYTPQERYEIDWVFQNTGWWAGHVLIKEGWSGIWSSNPRPFTDRKNIYFKKWPEQQGFNWLQKIELGVHESTHVWQWWNGGSSYVLDSLLYQGYYWIGAAPIPMYGKGRSIRERPGRA